jgi:hypothetical protein
MAARQDGFRSSLKLDWLTVLARTDIWFLGQYCHAGRNIFLVLRRVCTLTTLGFATSRTRSLDSTPSTIVFLTPVLISSFFKSVLAAYVAPGPEKSSTIESRAHSRRVDQYLRDSNQQG